MVAPAWDRFAHWRPGPARVLAAVLVALLVLSAIVPIRDPALVATEAPSTAVAEVPGDHPGRDADLALYDRIIERVRAGENYYRATVDEQRRRSYPVRPGLAVRLPTLAFIEALLGSVGSGIVMVILVLGVAAAWWKRFGDEPGGQKRRNLGAALIFMGAALALHPNYLVLHEVWAGLLIALSLGLHRPRRWGAALAIAALALAIREHALPYVLLLAAMGFWRRDWREGAAWSALAALFLAALAWHMAAIEVFTRASDPEGPGWFALRGMSGWLGNIVLTTNLRFLPDVIAGPLVLLTVLGWAGWRSAAGTTAMFLFLGYALAFMIAGRGNNFYWGAVISPVMFAGLAFVPMAVRGLAGAAIPSLAAAGQNEP